VTRVSRTEAQVVALVARGREQLEVLPVLADRCRLLDPR
jgi:hypothetical protein